MVEAADVILEVLDARDPQGCRCPQVEQAVVQAGANKRLVLVLNKIGKCEGSLGRKGGLALVCYDSSPLCCVTQG